MGLEQISKTPYSTPNLINQFINSKNIIQHVSNNRIQSTCERNKRSHDEFW